MSQNKALDILIEGGGGLRLVDHKQTGPYQTYILSNGKEYRFKSFPAPTCEFCGIGIMTRGAIAYCQECQKTTHNMCSLNHVVRDHEKPSEVQEVFTLKVSKGYLRKMVSRYDKPYDIRKGRRGFEVDQMIKFEENDSSNFIYVKIKTVLKSWEAPTEWGWDELGDFEVITFGNIWDGIVPDNLRKGKESY